MTRKSPLERLLAPIAGQVYASTRIVAGAMLTFHGLQKVFGILTENQPPVGSQVWIGGVLELLCGAAIAVGWFTRAGAFVASGMLAVAYVQFHWKLRFDSAFFPVVNKGELALLYSFVFLYMACKGGGPWSVDSRASKAR